LLVPSILLPIVLVVLLGATATLYWLTEAHPHSHFLKTYGPNLFSTGVGLLIAVVILDRLVQAREAQRLTSMRNLAGQKLEVALGVLLQRLVQMYKGAAQAGASRPSNVADFLKAWRAELAHFDVTVRTPAGPDGSWYRELSEVATGVRDDIVRITTRYDRALPAELVVTLDCLMESQTVMLMIMLGGIGMMHSASVSPPDHFEPFGLPGNDPEAFSELFIAAADQCAALTGSALTVPAGLWEDVIPPAWGSSRYARP